MCMPGADPRVPRPHHRPATPGRPPLAGRRRQVHDRRHHRRRHRLARATRHATASRPRRSGRSPLSLHRVRPDTWPPPGCPTVTHAIGDAGVRYVLDALSDIPVGRTPVDRPRVPHRIEHIETIPGRPGAAGSATLDVTASMQPTHCTLYTQADHSDNWSTPARHRARRTGRSVTRDLRDAGARLALGSDWPVAPFDAARRHRRRTTAAPARPPRRRAGAAGPGADRADGAWRATPPTPPRPPDCQRRRRAGSQSGYRADLSAFGLDPLRHRPTSSPQVPVPLTVVDGDGRAPGPRLTDRGGDPCPAVRSQSCPAS